MTAKEFMKNIRIEFILVIVCLSKTVSTSNGCGPMGLTIVGLNSDFLNCCNKHDDCYDSCGSSQTHCDSDFGRCMVQACISKYKNILLDICKMKAKLVENAVSSFGHPFFKISQFENNCF